MNIIAFTLILSAVIVFLVDFSGRTSRRLISLGLALLSAGLLIAAVWPSATIVVA